MRWIQDLFCDLSQCVLIIDKDNSLKQKQLLILPGVVTELLSWNYKYFVNNFNNRFLILRNEGIIFLFL